MSCTLNCFASTGATENLEKGGNYGEYGGYEGKMIPVFLHLQGCMVSPVCFRFENSEHHQQCKTQCTDLTVAHEKWSSIQLSGLIANESHNYTIYWLSMG